jgi:hypothetical protein
MALIILQITVCILLLSAFNTSGSYCNDSSVDGVDDISSGIHLLDVKHGSIHVNDDSSIDNTATTTECMNKFLSSSVQGNTTDIIGDDVNDGTTGTTTESQDADVSNQNSPTEVPAVKTHMNIGFGEIQMIQYDREATQQRLIEALLYMYNNFTLSTTNTTTTSSSGHVTVECKMQHELCAYWAARGECEIRPGMSITSYKKSPVVLVYICYIQLNQLTAISLMKDI